MDTLEQRVERLERSSRRWKMAFLALAAIAVGGAAAKPPPPPDAQFGHLTVQSLSIRSDAGGPFVSASCDKDRASIKLMSPAAQTLIALTADKNAANLIVSRNTANGASSANLIADQQSGFIDLHDPTGKSKEVEPE
jgi:hypothetical protein